MGCKKIVNELAKLDEPIKISYSLLNKIMKKEMKLQPYTEKRVQFTPSTPEFHLKR